MGSYLEAAGLGQGGGGFEFQGKIGEKRALRLSKKINLHTIGVQNHHQKGESNTGGPRSDDPETELFSGFATLSSLCFDLIAS